MGEIIGGTAEAFYGGVPDHIVMEFEERLLDDLWGAATRFRDRFMSASYRFFGIAALLPQDIEDAVTGAGWQLSPLR